MLLNKLADFEKMLADADVVILSDYGKGGLTHIRQMIELANARHKPVLVDPKGDDYARYRGATLLTPNRGEFREVAGSWKSEEELAKKAQQLRHELDLAGAAGDPQRRRNDALPRSGHGARTRPGA